MMEVVSEYRDMNACNSMCVNNTGSLALLAGRRAYGLVDLDHPAHLKHKELRHSKWEVSTSQWSAVEENLVAVASNNKLELLTWTGSELVLDTPLRSHTRVVTDISWHWFDTNLLATSSTDNHIYIWDRRDLRKPSQVLQSLAGATKIQWNKVSGKFLASAHEGEVKLWDMRSSCAPASYINAHLYKIYGLDWSFDQEDHLVTASQDSTVKFWNIASPGKAEHVMKIAQAPVWKVRYTPFGDGLLTLMMHTLLRGENNLMLWDRNDLRSPVHTFYGHSDMVLEFDWRQLPSTSKYQLVTWSKDLTLRLWTINNDLQRQVGQVLDDTEDKIDEEDKLDEEVEVAEDKEEVGDAIEACEINEKLSFDPMDDAVVVASPIVNPLSLRRQDSLFGSHMDESMRACSTSITDLTSPIAKNKSMNLNYEFSLINLSDELTVEDMNIKDRTITVSAQTTKNTLVLNVKFPFNYPNQTAPLFRFLHGTTIDNATRSRILQKLKSASRSAISRNRRCLESCLRMFEAEVDLLKKSEEDDIHANNPQLSGSLHSPINILGAFQDSNIPFPRTSGAKFCGDGNLVCFGRTRQYTVKLVNATHSEDNGLAPKRNKEVSKTPRAMSGLNNVTGGTTSPKYSMSMSLYGQSPQEAAYFPFKARVPRVRFGKQMSRQSMSSVDNNDISKLTGYSNEMRKNSESAKPIQGTVTIYNVGSLLPVDRRLANTYLLPTSPGAVGMSKSDVCNHNANVAAQIGRKDLIQIWSLAALTATEFNETPTYSSIPWACHPFGRNLLQKIMDHYIASHDIQTVATISCIFGNKSDNTPRVRKKNSKSESTYTDAKDSVALDALSFNVIKHNRSNSDTQSPDDLILSTINEDEETIFNDSKLLDPAKNEIYDCYIEAYAELLYRWQLLDKRTEVTKCLSESRNNYDKSVCNISVDCQQPKCAQLVRGPCCAFCHQMLLTCSVCRVSCRGLTTLCAVCGHGGHTHHLSQWFKNHDVCPTGCGCNCPQENTTM